MSNHIEQPAIAPTGAPSAAPQTLYRSSDIATVELPERFDVHATVYLLASCGQSVTVVLNGARVAFVDMHSLQAIVDARLVALDCERDLFIGNPSNELRATLELTGFDALIPIVNVEASEPAEPNALTLTGALGPARIDAVEAEIEALLAGPRPQLQVRLVDVDSIHLCMVNVLVKARANAREKFGDLTVTVDRDSDAERLLAKVGLVGTLRP